MSTDDLDDNEFRELLRLLDYLDSHRVEAHRRRVREVPPGSVVHHIDGNPWNMRIVDPKENER